MEEKGINKISYKFDIFLLYLISIDSSQYKMFQEFDQH